MKVKIKNKKNNVAKEIDSNLLGDYLATTEWEKVAKEDKPQENKPQEDKPKNKTSVISNSNE